MSDLQLSWCFSLFFFLFLVIWFIWLTSVNFPLCFSFNSSFDPSPASCGLVLRCDCGFGGCSCHPGSFLHCSWPPSFPCDRCPLTFVALPSVSCLSSVWPVTLGPLLMSVWCSGDDTFDHLHSSHTLAPHSQTITTLTPTRAHPTFPFNYPSPLSLRAAKVVKATAAVTNNSSSPVKELRDLSAMDAFRSRSISVSEHAVRRLGKILWVTEKKKKSPPTLPRYFVARSMGWLMGCHVGPLGGFQGVGDACWRKIGVSSELLSYTCCSHFVVVFLHVALAEAIDSRFNSICLHLQFCVFLAWIVCYVWSISERLMVEWLACVSNWKGTSFWGFVGFNHSAALVAGFSFFRSRKMFVWLELWGFRQNYSDFIWSCKSHYTTLLSH